MKISGITVCVDYARYLQKSLARWQDGLDYLVVVTTPRDVPTQRLCRKHQVHCYTTNVFYDLGAAFNKGAALSEAIPLLPAWMDPEGWIVVFDADITPPARWREWLQAQQKVLEPGHLYGANRQSEHGEVIWDGELAGFFQLFSAQDPRAQRRPLFDVDWVHAGGYDSTFSAQWPRSHQHRLSLVMEHAGTVGQNWFGIARPDAMHRMLERRRLTHHIGEDERL